MSVVRSTLSSLVSVLADAVAPDSVAVSDGGDVPTDPVIVRVVSLDRVGRSRRDGPVLDLELAVAVLCTGPRSLENVEQMLAAVEGSSRYAVVPLQPSESGMNGLGFRVRVPVPLRMSEPQGPPVLEPLQVTTVIGRTLRGIVVGPDGHGLAGASIRSRASALAVVSDGSGGFSLLSTPDPVQDFIVEYHGQSLAVTAPIDPTLTLAWAPQQYRAE
ncbi:hypothetical protein [Cryobacterium psychrophilum]|uniref:Carboxypeptidase regulatory-like domain-containing protein n=1 Tax=Cryobacterium psychrophilum TaxID=41988 RepID=A0A4Y8KNP1_9MICO|nr:hypothetical protein [Cryobacterium psychrophilum]TFD75738.1 hypothetical protein E3T53_14745 [Cryobacterium psychrophilum]